MPKKQKKSITPSMIHRISAVVTSCFILGWFWAGIDYFAPDNLSVSIFEDEKFMSIFQEFKEENLPTEEERQKKYEASIEPEMPKVEILNSASSSSRLSAPKSSVVKNISDNQSPSLYDVYLASAPGANCQDSDGGKNFALKGTTTWTNEEDKTHSFTDRQLGKYELLEYFCEDNHIFAQSITCRNEIKNATCIETLATSEEYFSSAPQMQLSQTFDFLPGWNWISFGVEPFTRELDILFRDIINEDGNFVIKDYKGNIFWPKMKINNLEKIELEKGYQIYVSKRIEAQIPGNPIPYPFYLSLKNGWNFISFPYSTSADIECMMKPLIQAGVFRIVEDQRGSRFTRINSNWVNEIGDFEPGKAYLIYLHAPEGMTYPLAFDPENPCLD